MDLDRAFYSYDQMRAFAEIGVALAEAQVPDAPEAPTEGMAPVIAPDARPLRRDAAQPHRVALSRAQDTLALLASQATPPADLSDVTAARVAEVRDGYVAAIARADERLATPEALWPVLGIDPARERSAKATAEAWVAAIDSTTQEV